MSAPKSKMDWMAEHHHQDKAARTADELVARLQLHPPIDPLRVAATEQRLLRTGGSNLGSRYDGKLEFVRNRGLFLLYYNTKYDVGLPEGEHHPRTRFSISHELGHFFIDHHHQALRNGARPHRSTGEFCTPNQIEREADAFAANLLMPTQFARPIINHAELSMKRIEFIAHDFGVSMVSAAIRSVRLSDFPCALAGIRRGQVAWMFPSQAIIESGIYPTAIASKLYENISVGLVLGKSFAKDAWERIESSIKMECPNAC
ncbi:MAG: ImmA/IrrE family metallo-endopeptidase, partial [Pirellulaceae bacterium]|nr:ImmA/IrrE family metallo-endopeptidase [Pirellulaceae bacterium]